MNVYSYMIIKNEADRYLFESVEQVAKLVDGLLIYDDQSDDLSSDDMRRLASMGNVSLMIRGNPSPSFTESEAKFRQDAWQIMEKLFCPRTGDWILTLDADEFLRTSLPLHDLCAEVPPITDALECKVHEVWDPEPLVRTDLAWGQITAVRLCRYLPGERFTTHDNEGNLLPEGRGSLPAYAYRRRAFSKRMDILHYGYARAEDRQSKYERYSAMRGHTSRHIQSILKPPVLAPLPTMRYDAAA